MSLCNVFAGTVSLRETDIDSYTKVSPWLRSVVIVPEFRNQGIGSWMVQEVMQFAAKLRIGDWYLYTPNKENFYANLGWRTIDKTCHQNVPGVIMHIRSHL